MSRFEAANGGTLFLDQIGDIPLELQSKLLRVLQEQEFERLGSAYTRRVDVRVAAATNQDLAGLIADKQFRMDLYYRLNVFPIRVPALRERKEDLPALVRYFVMKYSTKMGRRIETIPKAALDTLVGYSWPGNVRELANILERSVIISPGTVLELGEGIRSSGLPETDAEESLPEGQPTLQELTRQHIISALEQTGWRVSGPRGAAQLLGLKPTTLEARMKKMGIARPSAGSISS